MAVTNFYVTITTSFPQQHNSLAKLVHTNNMANIKSYNLRESRTASRVKQHKIQANMLLEQSTNPRVKFEAEFF